MVTEAEEVAWESWNVQPPPTPENRISIHVDVPAVIVFPDAVDVNFTILPVAAVNDEATAFSVKLPPIARVAEGRVTAPPEMVILFVSVAELPPKLHPPPAPVKDTS
jgi:hypothetical protein